MSSGHPLTAIRRVGSPWLDAGSRSKRAHRPENSCVVRRVSVTLVFIVFRSWRTLAAIMLTLARRLPRVGVGDIFGYSNSVGRPSCRSR